MTRSLLVAEVFGPTIQGEGPSAGRRCGFVRLGGCNLDCMWCDTPYTWDWTRFRPRDELAHARSDDLVERVAAMGVDMVVVTGGEPMLQQDRLVPFLVSAAERGWHVEVETNGTIPPSAEVIALVGQFNVSPKLENSGIEVSRRIVDAVLVAYRCSGRAVFKFVVEDPGDLDEVDTIVARNGLSPVYVMPQATDRAAVLSGMRRLADASATRGYGLTPRLHILRWGNVRGR
jgi:7-carboxy-7-deazaguanine synthase